MELYKVHRTASRGFIVAVFGSEKQAGKRLAEIHGELQARFALSRETYEKCSESFLIFWVLYFASPRMSSQISDPEVPVKSRERLQKNRQKIAEKV